MARYIDADKIDYTVTMVGRDEYAGYRAVAFESDIDEIPTADVVPKSEVERLRKDLDAYEETSGLKQAKTEVAREIFEEIESLLATYTYEDNYGDYISTGVTEELAELKKKYMKGGAE